jgi:hypothetical protein
MASAICRNQEEREVEFSGQARGLGMVRLGRLTYSVVYVG